LNKAAQRLSVRSFRQIRGETKYGRIFFLIWREEREEREGDSGDTCGLTHLYMCMYHLKMTGHIFLYDSIAAASLGQTTIYPVHKSRGQNDRRLYVPPFAGLQAVWPAPMVTQTLRRVSPEITTRKHKSGRLATGRRTPTGCGGGGRVCTYQA